MRKRHKRHVSLERATLPWKRVTRVSPITWYNAFLDTNMKAKKEEKCHLKTFLLREFIVTITNIFYVLLFFLLLFYKKCLWMHCDIKNKVIKLFQKFMPKHLIWFADALCYCNLHLQCSAAVLNQCCTLITLNGKNLHGDPPIEVYRASILQLKRVAHERSKGVLQTN